MAKTNAQIEKRKRETEKRKKLEKLIKRLAAEMPEDEAAPVAPSPSARPGADPKKP